MSTKLSVTTLSRQRIFPERRPSSSRIVPLSIVDATVVNFAPTAGVWFYENNFIVPTPSALAGALSTTLSSYPQWAGLLNWAPYKPGGKHTERCGRLNISYGFEADPGVEFAVAESSQSIAQLVPSTAQRMRAGVWEAGQLEAAELLPKLPSPLHSDEVGVPGVLVQITTFSCGGISVGVKMAHSLADAQTLLRFVHDWASVTRCIFNRTRPPALSPVFDPQALDQRAAGNINAASPDDTVLREARALPLHRFDYWASTEGCPDWAAAATRPPHEIDMSCIEAYGNPIPWSTLDMSSIIKHYLLYFTREEIDKMWADASVQARISRLDALLAHVWRLIIRARGLEHSGEDIHLDVTLGMRQRLSPALPDDFLGSPITLVRVTRSDPTATTVQLASSIRSTLSLFTSHAVASLLHETAFLDTPQRIWNAFLGEKHTIATSWLRLGLYDVDFGSGTPRYVDAVMPHMDGPLLVMEPGPTSGEDKTTWHTNGACVSLNLREAVMEELLKDPLLRRYRDTNIP
jgi:hypothetical protein